MTNTTTAAINPTSAFAGAVEFFPIPRTRERDPIFGLSRSLLYSLKDEGEIRFVCIRRKGNVRGRVLVDCGSVRAYLARMTKRQAKERRAADSQQAAATTVDETGVEAETETPAAAET